MPRHSLWVLAKDEGEQVIYSLGVNQQQAWEAAHERITTIPSATGSIGYKRWRIVMRKHGWRAKRCTLEIG